MFIKYKGARVYYNVIGNGGKQIVFLHGWGGGSQSFECIINRLNFEYKALLIDFPPFGNSAEPVQELTVFDYAQMVEDILNKEGFNSPIIVGHSFGGRIATILGSKNLASKLVLTSSAGLKVRHNLIYYFKVYKHKMLRRFKIKSRGGSSEYLALSTLMQKTFVNIVNTNLESCAINITVPTFLFWGTKDRETPIYMAKRFNSLIKNSSLCMVKGAGHFAYLENIDLFTKKLNDFIKENE